MSKHLESFRAKLVDGEEIKGWCFGALEGTPGIGVLVLTSRRIAFHRKGWFGETTKTASRDRISGVERVSNMLYKGRVEVSASGERLAFMVTNQEQFGKLRGQLELL